MPAPVNVRVGGPGQAARVPCVGSWWNGGPPPGSVRWTEFKLRVRHAGQALVNSKMLFNQMWFYLYTALILAFTANQRGKRLRELWDVKILISNAPCTLSSGYYVGVFSHLH
jgi:hypothetical protein